MVHDDFRSAREALNAFTAIINSLASSTKTVKAEQTLTYINLLTEQLHKRLDLAEKWERSLTPPLKR